MKILHLFNGDVLFNSGVEFEDVVNFNSGLNATSISENSISLEDKYAAFYSKSGWSFFHEEILTSQI